MTTDIARLFADAAGAPPAPAAPTGGRPPTVPPKAPPTGAQPSQGAPRPEPQDGETGDPWVAWLQAWNTDPARRLEAQRATGLWGDQLELLRVVEAWPAVGLTWDGHALPAAPGQWAWVQAWGWFGPDLRAAAAEVLARLTGATFAVARRSLDHAVARGLVLPDGTVSAVGDGLLLFAAGVAATRLKRPARQG